MALRETGLTPRRFTVDEYHAMAEAGILDEDERVELIDGEIVQMTPIGPVHLLAVARLNHLLVFRIGNRAWVSVQNPIRLARTYEPQPDFAIVRLPSNKAQARIPGVEDVFLLIEVADTSLRADRQVKIPMYAQHGVPEVWLVDLGHDSLVVYRDPTPDGYQFVQVLRLGESVAPLAFPDCVIDVAEIVG